MNYEKQNTKMINSIERFLTYVSDGDEEKTKIINSIYGLINEHENKIFEFFHRMFGETE